MNIEQKFSKDNNGILKPITSYSNVMNNDNTNVYQLNAFTPILVSHSETSSCNPSYTALAVNSYYNLLGNICFIYVHLRFKITALNGTLNYAGIGNLPFQALGFQVGSLTVNEFYACSNLTITENVQAYIYNSENQGSCIAFSHSLGQNAALWVVTTEPYAQIIVCGWYFTPIE